VINCGCPLKFVSAMDESLGTDSPCHPVELSNDLKLVENSGTSGSKTYSEDPQLEPSQLNLCDDKNNEENAIACKNEKYSSDLQHDKFTPKKPNSDATTKVENDRQTEPGIYSSTPNVIKKTQEDLISLSSNEIDFGQESPLNVKCFVGKQNLKRKNFGLQPIEELEEDSATITEKRLKVGEGDTRVDLIASSEASTSSAKSYFEAPAKSLLKKWQPSCLSRNVSTSSFIVLDECGETEADDGQKPNQEHESPRVDDFEIACQSLTEELMKSSSNIETLEKYHSQVQLENQMDDEKFDEILKELTMNVDLDDKTYASLMEEIHTMKPGDENTINKADKTSHTMKSMEESVDTSLFGAEDNSEDSSSGNLTVIENSTSTIPKRAINDQDLELKSGEHELNIHENTDDKPDSKLKTNKDKTSTKDEEVFDEDTLEDFLLEENLVKDKPYEFYEFVSTDPKENEDNYNPEWQKLGRLTSDEERYKAVRDRWRSLVPPDPNRNLTYRQWRARNNKSPIKMSPLNNNHQLMDDNERNQLCTAVFDNKISKIVQELEGSRVNIYRQRNTKFEQLAQDQDQEQRIAFMRGFNDLQIQRLHKAHLDQCRAVKMQYDQELKRIQEITEGKIRILREASEEVLLFQKFYKGVGARDDNDLYMTDIQVQELMETEEMLEQYRQFYK